MLHLQNNDDNHNFTSVISTLYMLHINALKEKLDMFNSWVSCVLRSWVSWLSCALRRGARELSDTCVVPHPGRAVRGVIAKFWPDYKDEILWSSIWRESSGKLFTPELCQSASTLGQEPSKWSERVCELISPFMAWVICLMIMLILLTPPLPLLPSLRSQSRNFLL